QELTKIIGFEDRHLSWAEVYMDLRLFNKALQHYEKAIKKGASADTLIRAGVANHHLKRLKARDKSFAKYLATTNDKTAAHKRVAESYEKMGVYDKALTHWRTVSTRVPSDSKAPFQRAKILRKQKKISTIEKMLHAWAAGQNTIDEKANAWARIGRYFETLRELKKSYRAYQKGIALGPSKSYRQLLMKGAQLCTRSFRDYSRAEEHFHKWITSAPPDQQFEARKTVALQIQSIRQLAALRNRILEDMVHARPNEPNTYLILANAYLKARPQLRDEALSAFQRFIELSKDRTQAVLAVGKRLHSQSTPRHAAQIYRMISPNLVTNKDLHLKLGSLFLHVNDKSRARSHFKLYLEDVGQITETQLRTLFRLARTLNRRGLHDLAVSLYERLLPLEKNKARVLAALGEALLANGNDNKADKVFSRYVKILKNSRQSIRVAAEAFYAKSYYSRARRYYERLFNADSRRRLYRYFPRLVDVYMKLGDKAAVLELASLYTRLTPSSNAWSMSAKYLRQAGYKKEALAFLKKAATLQPRSTKHLQSQVMLSLELSQIENAEKLLRKLIALRSNDSISWIRAGRLLTSRGYNDRAIKLYTEALKKGAVGGLIHVELGRIHLKSARPSKAHSNFVEAINRAVKLSKVLAEIRKIYIRASQVKRYQDLLRRTIALYPNHQDALFELGEMDMILGHRNDAYQSFERFASNEPNRALKVARILRKNDDLHTAAGFFRRALSGTNQRDREKVLGEYIDVLTALGQSHRISNAVQRHLAKGSNFSGFTTELNKVANVLIQRGLYAMASRLKEDIATKQNSSSIYRQLGQIYLRLGRHAKAKRAFQKYLNAGPGARKGKRGRFNKRSSKRFERIHTIAFSYEEMGLQKQALELITQSNLEQPRIGSFYTHRARLLLAQHKLTEGLGCIEEMIRQRAMENLAWADLNTIYRMLVSRSKTSEGLEVFKKGAGLNTSVEFSLILIKFALKARNLELANKEASSLLARTQMGKLRVRVGNAFYNAGYFLEAVPYFLEALEPGRGKTDIKTAVRMLLIIADLTQSKNLPSELSSRIEKLFENRDALNQMMAVQLFNLGNIDGAARHARQWVAAFSQSPTGRDLLNASTPHPWRLLMQIYLRGGRYENAAEVAYEYLAVVENPEEGQDQLARFLRSQMHYEQALPFFERVLENNKSDSVNRFSAAETALMAGNETLAKDHFDTYTAQNDARMYAKSMVAERYAAMGYRKQANTLFAQSGTWEWTQVRTLILMALKHNEEDTARQVIKAATANHPDPLALELRIASLYFLTPRFPADMAAQTAQRIKTLSTGKTHPAAILIRACVLAQNKKATQAKAALKKALKGSMIDLLSINGGISKGPQAARTQALRFFAAKALSAKQMPLAEWALKKTITNNTVGPALAAALQIIQESLELSDKNWTVSEKQELSALGLSFLNRIRLQSELRVWAVSAESEFYMQSGDMDAAINVFEDAIRRHPSNASYLNNLAYLLSRKGKRLEDALAMVRRAMQLQPEENLFYLDTEGWVLFKLGRYEEALKSLLHAVRYMKENSSSSISESLYHLAMCYRKLNKPAQAKLALRQAIKMDPTGYYGQKAFSLLHSKTEDE
ncbi:MAG TPA: tetratricopeptide repeat protein, partial [Myxococcales bacterium]|nr:tetratricopeptide repeat protein [Myxococcales bacterium]